MRWRSNWPSVPSAAGRRLLDNHKRVVDLLAGTAIVRASHDDTLPEHVRDAKASGCTISEFPTTLEAARTAHAEGLTTIGAGAERGAGAAPIPAASP